MDGCRCRANEDMMERKLNKLNLHAAERFLLSWFKTLGVSRDWLFVILMGDMYDLTIRLLEQSNVEMKDREKRERLLSFVFGKKKQ